MRKLPSRAPSPAPAPPPHSQLPRAPRLLPDTPPRVPTPATHPNEKHLLEIALDSSFLDGLDEQLLLAPMDAFLDACWDEVLAGAERPPALALGSRINSPMRLSYLRGLMEDDDPVYDSPHLDPFSLEEGEVQWAPAAELVGDGGADDVSASAAECVLPADTCPRPSHSAARPPR